MNTELDAEVMFKKQANLIRGLESVGGKISVTRERIIFQPHVVNFQSKPLEILISDIKSIEPRNTLLVVTNGVKVTLSSGTEFKFVVWNRSQFIDYINNQISWHF